MKRNFIKMVTVLLLLTARVAQADEISIEQQAQAQVQEAMRLARIKFLLVELAKAQAVEMEPTGKIVVKQSIRELLANKNLLQMGGGAQGGLCE